MWPVFESVIKNLISSKTEIMTITGSSTKQIKMTGWNMIRFNNFKFSVVWFATEKWIIRKPKIEVKTAESNGSFEERIWPDGKTDWLIKLWDATST